MTVQFVKCRQPGFGRKIPYNILTLTQKITYYAFMAKKLKHFMNHWESANSSSGSTIIKNTFSNKLLIKLVANRISPLFINLESVISDIHQLLFNINVSTSIIKYFNPSFFNHPAYINMIHTACSCAAYFSLQTTFLLFTLTIFLFIYFYDKDSDHICTIN